MSLLPSTTPYALTKKGEREKILKDDLKDFIKQLEIILVENRIKTASELTSQDEVLFSVVEWITSEDISGNFLPVVFDGTESRRQKRAKNEKLRRDKKTAAYAKLREFIIGGGTGKWISRENKLERRDVLKLILEYVKENKETLKKNLVSSTGETSTSIRPPPILPSVNSILGPVISQLFQPSAPLTPLFPTAGHYQQFFAIQQVAFINMLTQMQNPTEDKENQDNQLGETAVQVVATKTTNDEEDEIDVVG